MFIPIGDAPNPKGTPLVTWALIAANVAVFLLFNLPLGAQRPDYDDPGFREYVQVMARELGGQADLRELVAQTSAYELFAFEHGFRPAAPQAVDLLTCMFLHGGFMHLAGNMLFLWIYGDNVERRLGALRYLLAYLATGVVATLAHALVFSSSEVPLVGASGAISGVLGFYYVLFPRNTVRMLAFLPPFLMHVFVIPARLVLGMYLLLDNLLPFVLAGEGGVAHGAHIGGFIAGAAAAWVGERRRVERRPAEVEVVAHPASVAGFRESLGGGDFAEAARRYFALPAAATRGALAPDEAVGLASWLRANGNSEAALTLLRRVVRDVSRAPGLGEAYALTGAILLQDRGEVTAAYQYLLGALELGASPETEAAVRRMLAQIDALQKRRVGRLHTPPGWQ
jgi:membrane associated rhomboid family serine protease